jgi:hypothetical protein
MPQSLNPKRRPHEIQRLGGNATEWVFGPVEKTASDPSENPTLILQSSHIYSRSDTDSAYQLYIDWTCIM